MDSDFKVREEEKRKWRDFWGAALFISHYMREDEESHTDSATFDDNGLNFWFFPQAVWCSRFTGFAQCCTKLFLHFAKTELKTSVCSLVHHSRYAVALPSQNLTPIYSVYKVCFCSVITPNHSRFFSCLIKGMSGEEGTRKGRKITFSLYTGSTLYRPQEPPGAYISAGPPKKQPC